MIYDVVVSYAREDRELAVTLCNQLIAEGVQARIAPRVTKLDEGFAMEIAGMISMAKVLLVVMSADSNKSGQVIREVELATQSELEILIARLDDTKPTGSLGYYLSDKRWFSMKRKEVEPWETAHKISEYLETKKGDQEIAVEKVQASIDELKNKPETEGSNYKRKTYTAILAMLAIPLVFILIIWFIMSRFDFGGTPSDKEYEAARQHMIELQDPILEEAIRTTLSDQGYAVSGQLSEADLWELTSLKVISPDENGRIEEALLTEANRRMAENGLIEIDGVIETLDGLEYAKNLKELIVAGQSIQEIDPIANLTKLTFLDLGGNRISSIADLENLESVRVLILDYNAIRDIGVLEHLERVTELNLESNEIIDITSLGKMNKLKYVNLSNNKIHNIRALGKLESLEGIVIASNQINDIGVLADLKQLTRLNIQHNQVTNINELSSLTELQWLYLGENQIRDISVAKEFERLIGLGIENTMIQNIEVLEELHEKFKMLWIDAQTYDANFELMERLEEADIMVYVLE